MEKLRILKPKIEEDSTSVWDLFELDSLNRLLGLSVEGIIKILDRFSGSLEVPSLEFQTMVVEQLFERMGGTASTPPNEIMAFMFVLLNSPNFRFPEFSAMLTQAIYAENTLRYLCELDIKAPPVFIQNMYDRIGNGPIINILNARYSVTLATGVTPEEAELFTQNLDKALIDYYSDGGSFGTLTDIFSNN